MSDSSRDVTGCDEVFAVAGVTDAANPAPASVAAFRMKARRAIP
jgi:hypothetical protein